MSRSMWNGALALGELVVPVKVFAATEPRAVRFTEVHEKDGAAIEHRRVSAKTGRELKSDQIVKGYETSPGRFVVLTDEEIHAIERPERRAIEIEATVPQDQVDPARYDRAYFLGAQDEGRDAFAALLAALEKTGLVCVGRVVLRTKEQLVVVRPGDGVLRMSTLRYADELVDPGEIEVAAPKRAPTKREREMAGQLVEGLAGTFDPGSYPDDYHARVEQFAKTKARDKAPDLPEPERREAPDKLLDALKASLDGGSSGGAKKKPTKKKRKAPAKKTAKPRAKAAG